MAKFKVVTPKGTSYAVGASNSYEYENEALSALDAEIVEIDGSSENAFIAAAHDADAVYAKGVKFTKRMIDGLERCRIIALGSVGVDSVDVAAATSRGIPVTNVPDTFIEEVADHAMMLLLSSFRRLLQQDRMVREGRWREGRPALSQPRLMGQTLGFIAFGHVARQVALARAAVRASAPRVRSLCRRADDEPLWRRAGDARRAVAEFGFRVDARARDRGCAAHADGAPFPPDEEDRHLHQHGARADGGRAGAHQGLAGALDRRRGTRRARDRAAQSRQPAPQDGQRHADAARGVGLGRGSTRCGAAASARRSRSP